MLGWEVFREPHAFARATCGVLAALDVSHRRVGIALCDAQRILARPMGVLCLQDTPWDSTCIPLRHRMLNIKSNCNDTSSGYGRLSVKTVSLKQASKHSAKQLAIGDIGRLLGEAGGIVLGWPYDRRSGEGASTARVQTIFERLASTLKLPCRPLLIYDERYSTVYARHTLAADGSSHKHLLDDVAAACILQEVVDITRLTP